MSPAPDPTMKPPKLEAPDPTTKVLVSPKFVLYAPKTSCTDSVTVSDSTFITHAIEGSELVVLAPEPPKHPLSQKPMLSAPKMSCTCSVTAPDLATVTNPSESDHFPDLVAKVAEIEILRNQLLETKKQNSKLQAKLEEEKALLVFQEKAAHHETVVLEKKLKRSVTFFACILKQRKHVPNRQMFAQGLNHE